MVLKRELTFVLPYLSNLSLNDNDTRWEKMALFRSNKTIHIVYKNKKHQKIMIFSLNFLCSFKTKAETA